MVEQERRAEAQAFAQMSSSNVSGLASNVLYSATTTPATYTSASVG